eukprot:TRINITY_DN448_c0_g1_i1.p2 TRINITY_DN448_c0_g1~~TRINITY_DN448_c0_g1_i1.p2  ORF type:complete len:101 (-),score=31.83 TRINITY_DN448_c0_g1_i1:221-523(-)
MEQSERVTRNKRPSAKEARERASEVNARLIRDYQQAVKVVPFRDLHLRKQIASGEGASGLVYLATWLARSVAVKFDALEAVTDDAAEDCMRIADEAAKLK